ncbi:MAG: CoA transferase [Vicinamibacteria bacterium]
MSAPLSPLSGVTVLDLSRILAGPYCTMVLGDLGAEVLKVEPPNGDDSRGWGPPFVKGESAYFLAVNRNKRSICINLKRASGRDLLHRLAGKADVLVENFRPGTLDRLGFSYETIRSARPEIIYCSISGYGHSGPLRQRPGYDAVMQGEGGWMSLTGEPDGPPLKVGASLADIFTGTMAAQGILAALHQRATTGKGQKVDVALFDSVLATLCYQAQGYLLTGEVPERLGNRHPSLSPYETFQTADGYVIVGVGNDSLWVSFCRAVGRPDLDEPRFKTNALRVENYVELKKLLVPMFRSGSTQHWLDVLEPAEIPVGRVRSVPEALSNPQVADRQMLIEVEHPTVGRMRMTGNPIKMSGLPDAPSLPPPLFGQHTEEVLAEKLNLSSEEIEALREEGALGS